MDVYIAVLKLKLLLTKKYPAGAFALSETILTSVMASLCCCIFRYFILTLSVSADSATNAPFSFGMTDEIYTNTLLYKSTFSSLAQCMLGIINLATTSFRQLPRQSDGPPTAPRMPFDVH